MSNLINLVSQHLSGDVIRQLTQQVGATDPNQVGKAAMAVSEILVQALNNSSQDQQKGAGLMGALERDHDGGILGDLLGVFTGQKAVNNPKTLNGAGIVSHLLGENQVKAAQIIQRASGLDFFKSGVLMQLIAPVVMGVLGQSRKSNGLDLGGLAKVLMGGGQQATRQSTGGGILQSLLDQDGDGSMMDDLLGMGFKYLTKQ